MTLTTDPPNEENEKAESQINSLEGPAESKQADELVSDDIGVEDAGKHDEPSKDIAQTEDHVPNIKGDGNILGNQNRLWQFIVNIQPDKIEAVETVLKKVFEFESPHKQARSKSTEEYDEGVDDVGEKPKSKKKRQGGSKPRSARSRGAISPQEWLTKLTENQKLYAMMVVLLKGLDREILDNLYVLAVGNLRQDGLSNWLDDARTLGLDDLLNAMMATEEHGTIQLSQEYEEAVKHQIKNRHHLLWTIFEDLLANNEKEIAFSDREFREILGHAIGQVGLRYPARLENLLDKFAAHPSHRIVVIAGYALAEITGLDNGESKLFERILNKWVSSKHPDQSWAAAASIWRIYLVHHANKPVTETLWKYLETLVDDIDDLDQNTKNKILSLANNKDNRQIEKLILDLFWEKVDVISDALNHMFDAGPEDVVSHLKLWLQADEQSKQSFISQRAIAEILDRVSRPKFHTLDAVRWSLALFPSILDIDDKYLQDIAFSALRSWLTSEAFKEGEKQEIIEMTGQLIDKASSDHLSLLKNGLAEHCFDSRADSNKALHASVTSLLRRIFLVDGFPIIPSSLGNLVVFADASSHGRESGSLGLVTRLHPVLNSMIGTYVFLMGNSHLMGSPERLFEEGSQAIWHDLPRLVPGFFSATIGKETLRSNYLCALGYGPILNSLDLPDRFPGSEILHLKIFASKEDENTDNDRITSIHYPLPDGSEVPEWSQIASYICSFAIKLGIQANVEDLWKSVEQHITVTTTVNSVSKEILSLFRKIESGIATHDDYGTISCLYFWLLRQDSESAIKVCIDWLNTTKSNSSTHLAGISFGKFILRACLYTDCPPECVTDLSMSILKVCPDWTSFELILNNIAHLYKKQSQFSDADVINPSDLASFLPPNLNPRIAHLIDTWMMDQKLPLPLRKFGERLKLFIEVGLLSVRPDIEASQKFGLIFVDGDLSDRELLRFAFEFMAKLEKMPLGKTILPVLYRLGQNVPLAVGYGTHQLSERVWKHSAPNFLNPLQAIYPKQSVCFRAILVKNSIFDFDDHKQEWSVIPTVIFDEKRLSRQLDGNNLLYLSPYEYHSKNVTNLVDAIGEELARMVKAHDG